MEDNYMEEAIKEAEFAYLSGEVPVGAVIVKDGKIIARGHNEKEKSKDVTFHGEMIAIRRAEEAIDNWRLSECDMYVTLEPCPMCAGAIAQARLRNIYIGTFNIEEGACGSVINIVKSDSLNYHVNVNWMYNERCSSLLTEFFKKSR
ncbi:MAG TPA: nucleoside deaminase [Ruminiclostridium sp.]